MAELEAALSAVGLAEGPPPLAEEEVGGPAGRCLPFETV